MSMCMCCETTTFPYRRKKHEMARRSYKTNLGCIACDDLADLGAGKPGWLVDNPNLLTALDTHSFLLANRISILVLSWSDPDGSRVKIRPELSPIDAESISVVEWLVFDDVRVIVAGTSSGYLLVYSLRGELIYRQGLSSQGKMYIFMRLEEFLDHQGAQRLSVAAQRLWRFQKPNLEVTGRPAPIKGRPALCTDAEIIIKGFFFSFKRELDFGDLEQNPNRENLKEIIKEGLGG